MIGECIIVKVRSVPDLKYCWHGMVRQYKLWFLPVLTYHCYHQSQDACLNDVFAVVNMLYKEKDGTQTDA